MNRQTNTAEQPSKAPPPSIRELAADGGRLFWDALSLDNHKLYTLSNRFCLDYWSLEFRTFWGRRTHGRQGYYDRVGNFVYGGCFK